MEEFIDKDCVHIKYDMAKKEWYCKIKDTGLYDECKDCPGGSK